MGKLDMQQIASHIANAYEDLLRHHAVLCAVIRDRKISISADDCDRFLKLHPEISSLVHQAMKPIYDAIGETGNLESALKALRDMPVKGPVQ